MSSTLCRHYLMVIAEAQTPEDYLEWFGLVESKIRHFICSLGENPAVKVVHINPTAFTCKNLDFSQTPHCSWFLGVVFHKSEIDNIDLTDAFIHFVEVGESSKSIFFFIVQVTSIQLLIIVLYLVITLRCLRRVTSAHYFLLVLHAGNCGIFFAS